MAKDDELFKLISGVETTITELHGLVNCLHVMSGQCEEFIESAIWATSQAAKERCQILEEFHTRAYALAKERAVNPIGQAHVQNIGPVRIAVLPSRNPTNPTKE